MYNPLSITDLNDHFLCINLKFFVQSARIYGIATILLDEEEYLVNDLFLNLSTFSLNYNKIHRESNFYQFYEIITENLKETLRSQQKNYFRVKNAVQKNLKIGEKIKKQKGHLPKISIVEEEMKEILRDCISAKNINIIGSFERIEKKIISELQNKQESAKELEIQKKINIDKDLLDKELLENDQNNPFQEELNLIKCTPIVSPICGTPIGELVKGETILVIYGDMPQIHYKNKLDKRNYEIQKALIVKTEYTENLFKLTVVTSEKLHGIIEERENIKVKTVDFPEKKETVIVQKYFSDSLKLVVFLIRLIFFVGIVIAAVFLLIYLTSLSLNIFNLII